MVEIEKLRRGGERGGRGEREREEKKVKRKIWSGHRGKNNLTFSSLEHMIFISESVSVVPVALATSIMAAFSLRPT